MPDAPPDIDENVYLADFEDVNTVGGSTGSDQSSAGELPALVEDPGADFVLVEPASSIPPAP